MRGGCKQKSGRGCARKAPRGSTTAADNSID